MNIALPITPSRWTNIAISSALIWLATLSATEAASLNAVLKHLSHSSDEMAQSTGRILKKVVGDTDDGLEAAAKRIPVGKAASTDDVLLKLKKLGVNGDLTALTKELNSLSPSVRSALAQLVDDSRRILSDSGMSADTVMRSLEKGGPDAIFEARKMRSPESLRACLNGFDEYGESFAEFAKKADDLGVRKFDELKPELKRLPKNKLDDILKNPVKYFDANGRPLSALDDLLKSVPKVSVFERMGQIIYWTKNVVVVGGMVYVADQFIKVYQKLNEFKEWLRELFKPWCGSSLADILANSVWWIFLLGSVWLLVALFFPSIRSLGLSLIKYFVRFLVWGARRILGEGAKSVAKLSDWSQNLERKTKAQKFSPSLWQWFLDRSVGKRPLLRLGLLGYKRAGKTTFTVMLVKKLDELVNGASLAPLNNSDAADFAKMVDEVQTCKPTAIDKRIDLGLFWPFGRNGQPGGVLNMRLEVADFPGEYASPDASPDERDRLARHLRHVDGLLIVIDPTDLEAEFETNNNSSKMLDLRGRIASQRTAIESMFQEDGLDMGRSFRRAIAIVVTKRDALTSELLEKISEKGGEESKRHLNEMQSLAAQKQLTVEESHKLGYWVLLCLCPTLRGKLETMLQLPTTVSAPHAENATSGWKLRWHRFCDWLLCPTCPQLQIFCISQMGLELGQKVVEHRRKVQAWKLTGSDGDQPKIRLDLDNASIDGMDLHYPFRWLFDQIPNGWLHECAGLSFGRREFARWFGPYRRFPGAPAVQEAIGVSWRRVGTFIAVAFMLFLTLAPIFKWFDVHLERQFVINLLEKDSAGPATTNTLRQHLAEAHKKSTKPYPSALATFETLLKHHDELDGFMKLVNDEKQELKFRIEQAAAWLQLQHQLPEGDINEDRLLLKNYLARLREPVADILSRLKEHCVNLTDDSKRPTEGDWKLIYEQRKMTKQDGLGHSERSESVRVSVFEKLTNLCVEHEKEQFSDKIDKLLKQEMPDYIKAFFLIDGPEGTKLKDFGKQGQTAHDYLRANTVGSFWRYTEKEAKLAIDDANINRVSALYRDFLVVVGDPNLFKEQAKKLEDNAVQIVFEARVNRAKQESDAVKKWGLLSEVEIHRKSANLDMQNQWLVVVAEAKKGLKEWLSAFRYLNELENEKLRISLQEELRQEWFKFLKPEFSQLLANKKVEDASRLIVEFRKSHPLKDLSDQLDELAKDIPSAILGEILDQVMKIEVENPDKALVLLLNASVNIENNLDAKVLKQWRQKTVDLYKRLDKHPDAYAFLEELRDKNKKLPLLPHEKNLVDELWQDYVAQSKIQFEKLMGDPLTAEGAWRKLHDRARDERVSPEPREALKKYAAAQLGVVLPNPQENLDPKSLSAERKKFDALKQALRPWRQDKDIEAFLQSAETKFINLEFTTELRELVDKSNMSELPREIHKDLHNKFQLLIAKKHFSLVQKAKAEAVSREHLANWEQEDFRKILNAYSTKKFQLLSDSCDNYLNKSNPYYRIDRSEKEVTSIKIWLDKYKTYVAYKITGIKMIDLPSGYVWNYKPAVQIRNPTTDDTLHPEVKKGYGTFNLPINGASTLNWKLSDPLEIGIWDGTINIKGTCIGVVKFDGDFALFDAILRPIKVPYEEYDKKNENGLANLKVQLEVSVSDLDKFRLPPLTAIDRHLSPP